MILSTEPLLWNMVTEALKQNISKETYFTMYATDETIASGIAFLTYNVFSFWGDYVHPRQEITDFVNANFEELDTSLESVLHKIIEHTFVYGHCFSELVWRRKNGKYYLKAIIPLHPLLTSLKFDNNNQPEAVLFQADDGVREIPLRKIFAFKIGSGVYGESKLRRIYKLYSMKRAFFMFWATAMERYAMPIIHLQVEQTDESKLRAMVDEVRNVWSNGVIASTGSGVNLRLLEPSNNVSQTFLEAIEFLNTLIYRGLLLPQLLISARSTGTYALGRVHFELFSMAARRITTQLAEALVDQVVARILDNNFEDVDNYGRFVVTEQPSSDERFKLSQAFLNLINAGILDPVTDNEWIRNMLKFPVIEHDEELHQAYFDLLRGERE